MRSGAWRFGTISDLTRRRTIRASACATTATTPRTSASTTRTPASTALVGTNPATRAKRMRIPMSDRDLSASPPLSEQQVEQIRAFILTHGTRSLPSKAKVRDLCDSHERLRAQVSTLTDRAASSDVEAWGVFQDGVACVVAFPYQTRAEEFAARQADDALGAHTYTVAPLVRASTRSRRSEQEADTLIDAFAQAFGDCVERKSTRLNSSHGYISYAVFCVQKKTLPIRSEEHTPELQPRLHLESRPLLI